MYIMYFNRVFMMIDHDEWMIMLVTSVQVVLAYGVYCRVSLNVRICFVFSFRHTMFNQTNSTPDRPFACVRHEDNVRF